MNPFDIKTLTVGQMQENCYLVTCVQTRNCLIIDPGDDAGYITDKILSLQITPIGIVATHGHFDHVMAALELQLVFSIPFMMHGNDQFLLDRMSETASHFLHHDVLERKAQVTKTIVANDTISVGNQTLHVIGTPGHTPGSVSIYAKESGVVFVGDVLFQGGTVGRTDHSYGRPLDLHDSIQTILNLPKQTIIYPGHGEQTTVEDEMVYHRS